MEMSDPTLSLLLQFALAEAVQSGSNNRGLSVTQLVKYIYLADIAYAQSRKGNGEQFSPAKWKFFHFGPYSYSVQQEIDWLREHGGIRAYNFTAPDEIEFVRYALPVEQVADVQKRAEKEFPLAVTQQIRRAVRKYAGDQKRLLHDVYRTPPMCSAAPGEQLSFGSVRPKATDPGVTSEFVQPEPSARERKKAEAAYKSKIAVLSQKFKEQFARHQESLSKLSASDSRSVTEEAEVSAIFDEDDGDDFNLGSGVATVTVHDSIWKSEVREDDDD